MGMYDTIRCNYPLPDPKHNALEFQTKSLGRGMRHYTIHADGRLTWTHVDTEEIPENDPEYEPEPPAGTDESPFAALGRMFRNNRRETGRHEEEEPFHGDVEFYVSVPTNDEPPHLGDLGSAEDPFRNNPAYRSEWVEYVARFTEGRVARIWRHVPKHKLETLYPVS